MASPPEFTGIATSVLSGVVHVWNGFGNSTPTCTPHFGACTAMSATEVVENSTIVSRIIAA